MADPNLLSSGAGTASTASAAARAANAARTNNAPPLQPMQVETGPAPVPAGGAVFVGDGDSPKKIHTSMSMLTGDEQGQRKGARGGRNQRKNQTPQAQPPPAAGWAPPPQAALPPDLGAFGAYPNPYAGMQIPYAPPGAPPAAGYNAFVPYPHQPYAMMPPPTMYPGMPPMTMFPHMPPVPTMPEQAPASAKNAKSRNKTEGAAGGGKNLREPKGKRRTKGKNSKDEPSAAIEDDVNLSLLLNQVRRKQRDVSLDEVLNESLVVEFAKDQHGSRYLQQKLDEAPEDVKQKVYAAIMEEAADLSKEVFANHVVQKIFDTADTEQKKALVRALADNVASLSQDQYGCRVIQKAIQAVSKESQQQIARELEDHVESCIRNMHGNHVIQKCIEQMPPDSVNFVIKAVEQKAEETARHVYGCRVIQRLLEHCVSAQLEPMLEKILVNVAVLAKDAYGNYVVQHMLEHGRKEDKKRIIETIRANIAEFSKEKFSSNVVEKCFEAATVGENADDPLIQQERNLLMRTVLERPEVIYAMCTNTYGNYVVQKMLENTRGEEWPALCQAIRSVESQLNAGGGAAGGREDPREVFKHILTHLNKETGAQQ